MTVVISVSCSDGSIIMGSDSFCGDEEVMDLCLDQKAYMVGPIGVGICGALRPEQVLQRVLRSAVPDKKEVTEDWIKGELLDFIRESLKESGCLSEDNGAQKMKDSAFMLCFEGKVFYLDDDFGVWDSQRSFSAIGAGKSLALGALSSLMLDRYGDLTSKPSPAQALSFLGMALRSAAS